MSYKVMYQQHCLEMNTLVDILGKYVNAYRLMVGSAGELNSIALARKNNVKDTLKRVDEIGELMDCVIDTLERLQCNYTEYLIIKNSLIGVQLSKDIILTEIDAELNFNNSKTVNINKQSGTKRDDENESDDKDE